MPPDISQCVFLIEQALSVRALQEIISSNDAEAVSILFWEAFLIAFGIVCNFIIKGILEYLGRWLIITFV